MGGANACTSIASERLLSLLSITNSECTAAGSLKNSEEKCHVFESLLFITDTAARYTRRRTRSGRREAGGGSTVGNVECAA